MSNLLLNQNSNFLLLLAAMMQQQQQQQQIQVQQQQIQVQQQQREHRIRLLESLFAINPDPGEDAIELIAQRIESTNFDVANWFQLRREQAAGERQAAAAAAVAELDLHPNLMFGFNSNLNNSNNSISSNPNQLNNSHSTCANNNSITNISNNNNTHPSSTLLAKLNAVTNRQSAHLLTSELDHSMIDLLEALYAINDNPEPSAIDMISKRVNVTSEVISDWFDKKRLKLNPYAGPRSPPVNKKREGGRVVTFSEYQRSLLEAIFNENNYLHPQEYEELSKLIQVPSRNIKIWFKNRRSKQRLSSSGGVVAASAGAAAGGGGGGGGVGGGGGGSVGIVDADGVALDTNGT